jgi:hypothetical protein
MNTNPTVSRFVDRAKITAQPNTRAKAEEEGDSYEFSCISHGHYACTHGKNTHIIIDKDGELGCSCGDMTYRCTGTNVCKHCAEFLDLKAPPQIPAPGELIKKLMLMGWVGGKDDLHPAELLRTPPNGSEKEADAGAEETVYYECPKCGEAVDIEPGFLTDWKLDHMVVCTGTKANSSEIPNSSNPPQEAVVRESLTPEKSTATPPQPEVQPNTPDASIPPNLVDTPVPTNLAAALCNMQKVDLLAVTDSNNPFHNAKYADLASVWAAIRKPLTDNGLAVIQTTEQYQDGIPGVTTLMHISGESFTARLSGEVPKSKPDKNGQTKPNIQGLGSTITYLRRYSLVAMVGVAPVDDDGEAAMGR